MTEVHGTCLPGFEAVREEFARNLAERGELGAAVHVTLDGEPVVDLWAGSTDDSGTDRKSTRLNSSHYQPARMPSSA